jgi:Response regulator containing CheY-like receiver domain and AraC-type DNA-binding domain
MYRVIVVEDETIVRRGIVLTTNWTALNCVVVGEATNGEEGKALALHQSPDIIITDMKMPRMDGLEMVHALKNAGCKSSFIILTAYNDFKYAQNALRLGVADYLLKPLQSEELELSIQNILNSLQDSKPSRNESDLPMPVPSLTNVSHSLNKYVSEAITFISNHYNEDITISTVARSLGISEGHLSRLFKKKTSYTFTNYLIFYRIKLAMKLLENHRVKIYEVADQVGYTDTTYFSSQFKKVVGISPSEYQAKC